MHTNVSTELVNLESPTKRRFSFGLWPCGGVYHRPSGARPKTAIIATHYNADLSTHYLADYMAKRGYGFLGWSTRFSRGALSTGFSLEHALIDIGVGIRWLREVEGIEKVVILGNSGGASLMGTYLSQTCHPSIDPGSAPAEELLSLPGADMYISLVGHPGRAKTMSDALDPSVTDENDPLSRDPDLDMFDPRNGPPYSEEFLQRYRAAQVARSERITEWAVRELDRLRRGLPKGDDTIPTDDVFGGASSDVMVDRFFSVSRLFADPRMVDLTLDPSKRDYGCYMGDPRAANYSGYGHAAVTSLRDWLTLWSLSHTQVKIDRLFPHIHQPALVISGEHDQGCWPSYSQNIFDVLGSQDKTRARLDGGHYFEPPHGNRDQLADVIASWIEDKGGQPV
jgi:pimeloyl-ACP methyl ester carboxylesterase